MTQKRHIRFSHVFSFSIGAIVSTVCNNWTYFKFNEEINIDDLFTAVIGGAIGLYIGSKLTSKVSSDRVEKDLIIGKITSIKAKMEELTSIVETGSYQLATATKLIKYCRQSATLLKNMIEVCCGDEEIIAGNLDKITKALNRINPIVTGGLAVNGILNIDVIAIGNYNTFNKIIEDNSLLLIINVNRL